MTVTRSILPRCTAIKFGDVPVVAADFYLSLNDRIMALCRSLPKSVQAEALVFLMEYFRIQVGEPLDFFKYYHTPAWSTIFWMMGAPRSAGGVSDTDIDDALSAQAMAMLLHSVDDHLVDGNIPVTHLSLLVRSQAWRRMNESIDRFCIELPDGSDIARVLMNDYYSGITERETPSTLDGYCGLFRKQMATWVVMPVLTALKASGDEGFVSALRSAYESFGIAWRLIDDIQDLETDVTDGTRSAVYVSMNEEERALWDSRGQSKGRGAAKTSEKIYAMIEDASILEIIAGRIVRELHYAAGLADKIGLGGLADEFKTLVGPVVEWLG